jgi:hypothetical protein
MKNFVLPEDFGNKVVTYLTSKPWLEVDELIQGFKALTELVPTQVATDAKAVEEAVTEPEKPVEPTETPATTE